MCGRFSVKTSARDALRAMMKFTDQTPPELWGRFNIAPQQSFSVLRRSENALEASPMVWGFIPCFAKEDSKPRACINARAETVATNGYFRAAFKKKRCVIPATGYFEWKTTPEGKQPYNIHAPDHAPFLFAGIWDQWKDIDRAAIVTTTANHHLKTIHDRMPVVIRAEDVEEWLSGSMPEHFLHPAADDVFIAQAVSTAVGNVRNQGEHLIEPIAIA